MLADGVFKNLAMRVTIDKAADEGSDTADFIEELKELSNLHFKNAPASATAAPQTTAAPTTPELKPTMPAEPTTEQEPEPSA